jgi:rhomboid family protein
VVFPLYDENPFKQARVPYVTWGLIAINVVTFVAVLSTSDSQQTWIVMAYGVVPALITGSAAAHAIGWPEVTLLSSMFLHAGWAHLLGNMIYLWVFGDDIEDALGPVRFLLFYLLAGVAAALVFVAVNPDSGTPLIGASGAISGVLAAYLMLRPCAKVSVFVLRVVVRMRSYWVIGGWALLQFLSVAEKASDGVAYLAHVGGLAAGALLFFVLRPAGTPLFECVSAPGDFQDSLQ